MNFQIGDRVIHCSYGLGEIIGLDEKELSGHKMRYYVVRAKDLTVWVPVAESDMSSLRFPTPGSEFGKLFAVLGGSCELLSNDRLERKAQLSKMMKEGKSEAICRVVRDLSFYRRTKKLNENDVSILKHALNSLLNEWQFSLSVSLAQAEGELQRLLDGNACQATG